jgi:hypothetical protein
MVSLPANTPNPGLLAELHDQRGLQPYLSLSSVLWLYDDLSSLSLFKERILDSIKEVLNP